MKRKHSIIRSIFSKWTFFSLFVTLALWAYAVMISFALDPSIIWSLADQVVPKTLRYKFVVDFLVSVGAAIIISRIVAITVDFSRNKQQDEQFQDMLERQETYFENKSAKISENAFYGAFGVFFEKRYVEEVISTAFPKSIMRTMFDSEYWIDQYDDDFLQITVKNQIENTNCGKSLEKYNASFSLPLLPNEYSRAGVSLEHIKINGNHVQDERVIENVDRQIRDMRQSSVNFGLDSYDLQPGATVNTEISYKIIKYFNDVELYRSFYPTEGMSVRAHNKTAKKIDIGIRSIHRIQFETLTGSDEKLDTYRWELRHPTLPYQGYLLYWNVIE